MKSKEIDQQYFSDLIHFGSCVPRDSKGNTMNYRVGSEFTVKEKASIRTARVICTQDCPCSIKLITPNTDENGK